MKPAFFRTVASYLASLQMAVIAIFLVSSDTSNIIVPVMAFGSALCLVVFMLHSRVSAQSHRRMLSQSQQLREEVKALNAHAMVVLADASNNINYVNPELLKLTGHHENELIGEPLDTLYFREDAAQLDAQTSKVRAGETWSGESRIKKRDGGELWTNLTFMPSLNQKGQVRGSIGVRTDITDVMRLKAEKEVFQALSMIPDEVYIFDLDSLRCKYANATARSNLPGGVLTEVGALIVDIDPIFDSEAFALAVDQVLTDPSDSVSFDMARKDRQYEAQIRLMPNNTGGRDALLILQDVSDVRDAARIKSEFVSTVSHELRSPMTSIKGSLGLALAGSGGELPSAADRILRIAHRNADRLILIINDLLDIEKIAAGKMSFSFGPCDLCAIVDEAILANEGYAGEFGVSIKRSGVDEAFVMVDFDRTLQMVNNLISNAAKFSKPNSEISVRVLSSAKGPILEVQDYGEGIPEGLRNVVFDKFATNSVARTSAVRGTGLGLAIVKAIAENQNCSVDFSTALGVGTTFKVRFPGGLEAEHQINAQRIERLAT